MNRTPRRRGLTLIELVVLLVIAAILTAMLAPALVSARVTARRSTCFDNMKKLGTGFFKYHSAFKRFPASSTVTRDGDGEITAVDGWSFHVRLLHYMDNATLYNSLNGKTGHPYPTANEDSTDSQKEAAVTARNTQIPGLICPDNPNPTFVDPQARTGALTNYKAMGATHLESLQVASPTPTTPLYLPEKAAAMHPDGALFPGRGLKIADYARFDGTAHTILCVETIDPQYGVWTVGAEVTLVGLPSEQPGPDGKPVPLKIEEPNGPGGWAYRTPAGFNGKYGDEASPEIRRLKTYLGYDFAKAVPGSYVGADKRNKYGPSSGHPGIVNHLMVDCSVVSVSTDTDFATYMFLVTRRGSDPSAHFRRE